MGEDPSCRRAAFRAAQGCQEKAPGAASGGSSPGRGETAGTSPSGAPGPSGGDGAGQVHAGAPGAALRLLEAV